MRPCLTEVLLEVRAGSPWPPPGRGLLLHHLDLDQLIRVVGQTEDPLVVDLDSVDGLSPDRRAAAFLIGRLGIGAIVTRHAPVAAAVAAMGGLALFRVFAFDSTGLERSMIAHPRSPAVGTVVSPGLVLPYLAAERAELPGPLVGYGLIRRWEEVEACRRAGADSVVLWLEDQSSRVDRVAGRR
ncbi:MAG TPA: glycerol-3-phosphate responsive antiterminator [Candidatus Dormibacteraeota bacterium]|jgi:glycerol-3-phosphate responsive antiterminator|nr:glycerol-3-phosphate responsive antiterminator [Candidatus Dormibacteraeota bacterium]